MIGIALRDVVELAFKGLKNRRLRSALTMIGIFIGIAAVVSLIALGQGMRDAVTAQFSSFGTDVLTVQASTGGFGPPGTGVVDKLTEDDVEIIRTVRGVDIVTQRIIRSLEYESDDEVVFEFGASMPDVGEEADLIITNVNYAAAQGRLLEPGDRNKVMIGNDYATESVFSKPLEVGDKFLANGQEVEVVGILERRGNFIVDGTVVFSEDFLRDLLDDEEDVDAVIAKAIDGFDINEVTENINRVLRNERGEDPGEETFEVSTPQDALQTIDSLLFVVQMVVVGIAGISLFVGGVGIMNTMYTSVLERTKQIGVMKAIGARNNAILSLFLFESGLLGMLGGLIGVILGVVFSKLVEFAAQVALGSALIQASISTELIVASLAFSFIVGGLSGVVPAYQASKLKPVDVLRYE